MPTISLKSRPINEAVYFVSFAHRPRGSGGAFYDYTARYGAVRDEDRLTLRQSIFLEESGLIRDSIKSFIVDPDPEQDDAGFKAEEKRRLFEDLSDKLGLKDLLDLPLVALSNGQTRRARIVKALLERPDILLLDEPLSGSFGSASVTSGSEILFKLDLTSKRVLLCSVFFIRFMRPITLASLWVCGCRTQSPSGSVTSLWYKTDV